MEKAIFAIHLITALIIIVLILMQQGKGAEAGASFGAGASQTIFGSAGSWNFFSKMTAIFATIFFVTSFGLAIMARNNAGIVDEYLPELEQVQPQAVQEESDIPAGDSSAAGAEIPVVPAEEVPVLPAEEIPVQ